MQIAGMAYSEYSSTAVILINHNNGFFKVEYNPATFFFSSTYSSTTFHASYPDIVNGFTFIGGQTIASSYCVISKLIGNAQDSAFVLNTDVYSFMINSASYSIGLDGSLVAAYVTNPTLQTGSLSLVSPGTYVSSSTHFFDSDIIYLSWYTSHFYV